MRRRAIFVLAAVAMTLAQAAGAASAATPEIRLSASNRVPACVTPERLMAYLKSRNPRLDPRYKSLAAFYKQHGETWRVRWDYAFFQMAVETNFLTYRRPDGRMGDVDPKQNNFAGIGTTGGGVPGDSFPDVKTGVLAQIQHLVVYSGETIAAPVAPRTQLKQEHILLKSRELNRPVRFSDLARRWAADPKYGQSIEWAAEGFRSEHCRGKADPGVKEVLPWATKTNAPGAAPPADTSGPRGSEAQTSASSPVRTIWTRGEKPLAAPKVATPEARAAPAPAPAKKIVVTTPVAKSAQVAAAEPMLPQPGPAPEASAAQTQPPAPAAEAAAESDEPSPHFALLSPPAMLTLPAAPAAASAAAQVPPTAPTQTAEAAPPFKPAFDPVAHPPSGLGAQPARCNIETASFGGDKAVLIRTEEAGRDVRLIAVSVLDGFEESMAQSFISSRAQGGQSLGAFANKEAALAKAHELCPSS